MDQSFREKMLAAWDQDALKAAELSRRSGVTYDVINKLKRGDVSTTSAENARRIAFALGFDWAEPKAGLSEPPPASYTRSILEALDREEPDPGAVKPYDIQHSQVDGTIKIAAVIRDAKGFAKLRATIDALEALYE